MFNAPSTTEDEFLCHEFTCSVAHEKPAEPDELDRLMSDRDAVAKLLSENRMFKEILEQGPMAFSVYGTQDELISRNAAYLSLCSHVTDVKQKLDDGKPIIYGDVIRAELARTTPADQLDNAVAKRVEAHHAAKAEPTEFMCDHGDLGAFRVVKWRLSNGAVAAMGLDITELKNREADLVEARRVAVASERSKSAFLANMSHELRTPLNAIMGFSELTHLMLNPETCPKELEYLSYILDSGNHLVSLINDLLDLSQLEAQARELTEAEVSIPSVLRGMHAILSPLARKKNIQLDLKECAPDLALIGDERAIRQMILNLGANAISYTPKDGHVTLRSDINAEREIELTIEDNGPGIAPDELDAIREPFVRAKAEIKAASTGAGLGLSITRHLAALHDARLCLDSTVGQGTTAQVIFPQERTLSAS